MKTPKGGFRQELHSVHFLWRSSQYFCMTYLRKLQIALDLFCLYEIGMAIVWIFMDIANGGISKLS